MSEMPNSIWRIIGQGMASIAQGMSTFSIWPDTDYQKTIRDLQRKYPRKHWASAKQDDHQVAPNPSVKPSDRPAKKQARRARWKKRKG